MRFAPACGVVTLVKANVSGQDDLLLAACGPGVGQCPSVEHMSCAFACASADNAVNVLLWVLME